MDLFFICMFLLHIFFSIVLPQANSRDPSHSMFPSQETTPRPCRSPEVHTLSNTPISLQNPVMRYNLALSRTLSFPCDCHFPYITVIQLICRGLGKRAMGDWAKVSSKSCLSFSWLFPLILTHTWAYIKPVSERWEAGGPKRSERMRREREKVTEAAERVWVRGESVRERGRMRRKGRIKQQAKWERKGEGRNPPECFFAPTGQKVTAWRG